MYSFVIAKTMPVLLHLKIYGEMPTNDGVLAILGGCPLLKSLDLKGCYSYYFSESLEKRCRNKLKISDFQYKITITLNSSGYEDCYFDI